MADATVIVASPSLPGGPVTATTGVDGTWRVPELLPGIYTVTATAIGYRVVEHLDVRLSATGTIVLDITLPIAGVEESVRVTASRPLIDVRSPSTVTTVNRELLEALPIGRANTFAVSFQLPGVNQNVANGAYFFGLDFRVDGMAMNDARQGGTSLAPMYSVRWFEEVQFAGLGPAAEYGDSLGGTANLTLRSGSERLTGLTEFSGTRQGWTSDNRGSLPAALQQRFRPREVRSQWEGALQAGGPLSTNKLFWFSGYERTNNVSVPAGSIGIVPFENYRHRFLTKVHAVPSSGLRFEGVLVRSADDRLATNGSSTVAPEALLDAKDRFWQWSGRVTWVPGANTLVEARVGGAIGSYPQEPRSPGTRGGPPPHQDLVTGILSGNVEQYFDLRTTRQPIGATVTRVVNRRLGGSHVLKMGVEIERITSRSDQGYPGGRLFQDRNGQPDQVLLWDGDVIGARGTRTSVYLQDTWQVSPSITMTPGVRININRASTMRGGDSVFRTSGIGPRFGVAWAPHGPQATVLRAAYARVYETLFGRMADFLDFTGQTPRITARVLGPDSFQELNRVTPATNIGIADTMRHPYVDEWAIGAEHSMARSFSVRTQYAHRRFRNILAFVDTGSVFETVQRQDPGPDNVLGTSDDGAMLDVYSLTNPGQAFLMLTNPSDAHRNYHGLSVAADKRFSDNWQMLASYTWSRSRGTVGNENGSNVGAGESAGQSGYFANPNAAINSAGVARYDYPHEVKLQGLYVLPHWGGATLSVNYLYLTGEPWGRRATIAGLRQGNQTIRIEPRGTARLGATSSLDVRVEKTLQLGHTRTGVYADLLNVTNRGTATGVTDTSGASLGVPSGWSLPRTLRLGARVWF